MPDYRLGDELDDYCIKCKRVTNHSLLAMVDREPAKLRCRSCYHEHNFRHSEAPPSKKEQQKADLFKTVLSSVAPEAPAEEAPAKPPTGKKPKR
ncbi:MAG: hypothetical protein ABSC08_06665 [Bryobacteraceae bacterium]|jgi:hypothetical protein